MIHDQLVEYDRVYLLVVNTSIAIFFFNLKHVKSVVALKTMSPLIF